RRYELLLRALSFAALFAVHHRELRASDAPDRRLVLEPLARDPHRRVSSRLPRDLLLLPSLLLPRVLLVTAGMRRPGRAQELPRQVAALPPVELGQYLERAARALGMGEPPRRRKYRRVYPTSRDGRAARPEDRLLVADVERHDYDVVVIGAGGAGLRAAIEADARGAKTAVVCKSLLGKAQPVMAGGGVAAAGGDVWPDEHREGRCR